ncbi:MAG TPA: hypothetical protein VG754_06840, partial [Verrucomicrobiae bacterium]|nr:hypothetical protein [Verrucomicrobiae bacterium]
VVFDGHFLRDVKQSFLRESRSATEHAVARACIQAFHQPWKRSALGSHLESAHFLRIAFPAFTAF